MEGHTITGGTGHVFAKQLTNLVSPKNTKGFKFTLLMDHHRDVVDGIVIITSAGMLTLDILWGVGGQPVIQGTSPANVNCHGNMIGGQAA